MKPRAFKRIEVLDDWPTVLNPCSLVASSVLWILELQKVTTTRVRM
jgi:hypothetical protein